MLVLKNVSDLSLATFSASDKSKAIVLNAGNLENNQAEAFQHLYLVYELKEGAAATVIMSTIVESAVSNVSLNLYYNIYC